MAQNDLLTELATRPLCCDGAMGTQLLARGLKGGKCGMLWNVDRTSDVREIHEAYRSAGADLVTTNSFGGSRFTLDRHGLADRADELNRAAAEIARVPAGETGWVLGDVGPFGDFLQPLGETTPDQLRDIFRQQIEALLAGGADAILLETMSDPAEAVIGIEAAKACETSVPAIVTYAFQKTASGSFRTMMGTTVDEAIQRAADSGAQIIGANCGTRLNLNDYVELAKQIVAVAGHAYVMIQPNAGRPHTEDGRTVYDATPEQMAMTTSQLLSSGVRIVGGCCGTTAEHLVAISRALKSL
ncbi:MAG: homocysteine S-methyltransferase family protein [Verrucomicrobia bacterium]|nr:homocysteine S-methyltransferase family protein [Verrucomicrobiota bacterium]